MKRALPVLLLAAALCAGLAWLERGRASREPVAEPLASGPQQVEAPRAPVSMSVSAHALPMPTVDPFVSGLRAVSSDCDLPVHTACDGPRCVALARVPDLDRPLGWAAMLWRSPRFVLGTAARDLGLPADGTACGAAIGALVDGGGVAVSVPVDGGALWCASVGLDPLSLATCERAAGELGAPDAGFTRAKPRVLDFRRGG